MSNRKFNNDYYLPKYMKDGTVIKEKIIQTISQRGPSLPIHVAKATELPTLFASAFLSELISERRVRLSNMKVGGSPLYLLPGQEPLLEKFEDFLKGKEKEAFLLLKEQRVVEHAKTDPAIRVALAYLKDFAVPFQYEGNQYWRYYLTSETESRSEIQRQKQITQEIMRSQAPEIIPQKIQIQPQTVVPIPIITKEELEITKHQTQDDEVEEEIKEKIKPKQILKRPEQRPQQIISKEKQEKEKIKSDFVVRVVNYLLKERIELVEEKDFKKREFYGTCTINSHLGKIDFFIIGKDKKHINEDDITIAVQQSHTHSMPVLLLSSGDLDKRAQMHIEKYKNIIKFRKI